MGDAAKDAGMRYVVFTTKHHDGFSMFDTQETDYRITSPRTPFSTTPRADVTRGIFDAFRAQGFMVGAYFSKPDWKIQDPQIPKSIWYFTDALHVGFRVIRPLRVPTEEERKKLNLDPEEVIKDRD